MYSSAVGYNFVMLIPQSVFIGSGCIIYRNYRVIELYIPRTSALATVLCAENNTPYMYLSALATVLCAENNTPYMYSSTLATVPSADNILIYYRYSRVGNCFMRGNNTP